MSVKKASLLVLLPILGACVPRAAAPAPVTAPTPQQQAPRPVITAPEPMPAPIVQSAAAIAAWADAPVSPGRWAYQSARGAGSRALWGPSNAPSFIVACEPGRSLSLTRIGPAAGALTIRTSTIARPLPGTRAAEGLRASVPANDPLLDAIAFSRGRFAVEAQGTPALVIPTWPEVARVVEDCRR
jgi:hypothetical protein